MKQNRPLSYSSLKAFAQSPNHLLAYWAREVKATPAMIKGSLIHTLILEPETFADRYAIFTGARRAGAEWTSFQEVNAGKEFIKQDELDEVKEIVKGEKSPLLNLKKETEKLIEWKLNGINFKGFVDAYGNGFIMDIKTCSDASPKSFQKDIVNLKYHWQAYLYLRANEQLKFAGPDPDFFILAVETSAPYNVQTYKLDKEFIAKAESEIVQLIERFKDWDGSPYGYEFNNELNEDGVITLTAPSWL